MVVQIVSTGYRLEFDPLEREQLLVAIELAAATANNEPAGLLQILLADVDPAVCDRLADALFLAVPAAA